MGIINATNVYKTFGNYTALNNVSLNVPEGSIYGLLGPNGAGKTTLIRIINQILAPDSGEILFKGKKLNPDDIKSIGYLPEERGLYKKMKVGEQSIYLARLKGLSRNDALKKIKYWFEKFEMLEWWNKKVEELSKGMQQKVQFITTILHEPELLIFDEPFSGFDPINANMLKNEILELKSKGSTIIFSTHNMGSVEELCDYITLINKSRCILEGQVDEIRSRYKSGIFEVQFDGNPEGLKSALNSSFELQQIKPNHKSQVATIKMTDNAGNNELLNLLIPKLHIMAYREVLPGMNEVFISVVENSSKKENEQE
jgi:ABC-2 type transport system ATP-binding protein